MPLDDKYKVDFVEHGMYHIYNRTNNKERLFLCDEDYLLFLKRYNHFLSPFVDTYAWSLLPNHFHFFIRVKSIIEIEAHLRSMPFKKMAKMEKTFLNGEIDLSFFIEQVFKRLFQSYSLLFNKKYERKGNLFHKPFKRVEVTGNASFTRLMVYIHANAQKHDLVTNFMDWSWSSWHSLLAFSPTKLLRNEVLEWFGGKDAMIKTHLKMTDFYSYNDFSIEK